MSIQKAHQKDKIGAHQRPAAFGVICFLGSFGYYLVYLKEMGFLFDKRSSHAELPGNYLGITTCEAYDIIRLSIGKRAQDQGSPTKQFG